MDVISSSSGSSASSSSMTAGTNGSRVLCLKPADAADSEAVLTSLAHQGRHLASKILSRAASMSFCASPELICSQCSQHKPYHAVLQLSIVTVDTSPQSQHLVSEDWLATAGEGDPDLSLMQVVNKLWMYNLVRRRPYTAPCSLLV